MTPDSLPFTGVQSVSQRERGWKGKASSGFFLLMNEIHVTLLSTLANTEHTEYTASYRFKIKI
jgi:hypothetical protein